MDKIEQGDEMTKLTIEGDTKSLFEKAKADIDKWNTVLDKKYPKKNKEMAAASQG